MVDKKDTIPDGDASTTDRVERTDRTEEQKDLAKKAAEEAQTKLPENITCELCHQSLKDTDDWVTTPLGYAHKDGNCPKPPKGHDDEQEIYRYGGGSELVDRDGNPVQTQKRSELRERLGNTELEDDDK